MVLLLQNGGNANAKINLGWTPLFLEAVTSNPTIIRLLVEQGAKIDSTLGDYDRQGALHYAAALGNMGGLDVLLEMGCDREARDLYEMDAAQIAGFFG